MGQKAFSVALSAVLLLGMLVSPLSAQSSLASYETYIVDSFDDPGEKEWFWLAAGSRFVTDGYPVVKYFDGMPNAMRIVQTNPEVDYKVMGIQFKFNRQADNWVDIIPAMPGENGEDVPYEIPLRGRVSRIDVWVWGAGYMYELEALVRDYQGRVHALSMGWLNFDGWRNLSVNVPTGVPQVSRYLGDDSKLRLVALRIRTSPRERVDNFQIFFDQLRVFTNTYGFRVYDGIEFADAEFDYSAQDANVREERYIEEDPGL